MELVLSFCHMDPGIRIQVVKLGSMCFHLRSHLLSIPLPHACLKKAKVSLHPTEHLISGRRKVGGDRTMSFFRLNKITRHPVTAANSTNYHIHWSQLRVRLVKMETRQVSPVLSRVPKSSALFALSRGPFIFHPTAGLQVSLSLWKSQPLLLPSASLWGKSSGQSRWALLQSL